MGICQTSCIRLDAIGDFLLWQNNRVIEKLRKSSESRRIISEQGKTETRKEDSLLEASFAIAI